MPRMLVVEDGELMRTSVADARAGEGYAVEVAADGSAGLACAQAERPDVIILDLMLPVMDGWTFLRLRLATPAPAPLPVLVLSAARQVPEFARGDFGPVQIISEPFDLDVLLDSVAATIPI